MAKEVFELSCPCCGKRIEVNTRSGNARAVKFEESKRGKDFDSLVADQTRESERLGSVFDDARGDVANQEKRLDDLLGEAKEAAKKDRSKKPPHPFQHD